MVSVRSASCSRVRSSSSPSRRQSSVPVIHLVRHGQASFGTDDYDRLSDLGRMQATLAGRELARRGRAGVRAARDWQPGTRD